MGSFERVATATRFVFAVYDSVMNSGATSPNRTKGGYRCA